MTRVRHYYSILRQRIRRHKYTAEAIPDTNFFSQLNYNSLTSLKSTLPHCKIGELLRFICFINTARQIYPSSRQIN